VLVSNGLITLHKSHMIKPGNNANRIVYLFTTIYFYYLYFYKSCMLT